MCWLLSQLCKGCLVPACAHSGHLGISEQKPVAGFAPIEGTRLGAFNGWTSWVMGSGEGPLSALGTAQAPERGPSVSKRRGFGQGFAQMLVQLQLPPP